MTGDLVYEDSVGFDVVHIFPPGETDTVRGTTESLRPSYLDKRWIQFSKHFCVARYVQ